MRNGLKQHRLVLLAVLIGIAGTIALQCTEEHACTAMGVLDQVTASVVPESAGDPLPAGTYDLQLTIGDDDSFHATWSVDEQGVASTVSTVDPRGWYMVTSTNNASGGIDIEVSFNCPKSPLSVIAASLTVDGGVADEFTEVPTYNADQPTEDNGEGCGKCYRMELDPVTLSVPALGLM